MLDATKSSTPKKITVELTMHSIARLHDRISFLRESNDNELLSKLNSQLKEGLLRNNSKTAAYRLGYEGLKYEFVLAKNSDAYFKAVTFKNMWHVCLFFPGCVNRLIITLSSIFSAFGLSILTRHN